METVATNEQVQYMAKWLELSQKMVKKGFTWSTLEQENEYQYMSFNVLEMQRKQWDNIQIATSKIGNIVNKAYKIIFEDASLQAKLGLPAETMEAIKIHSNYFSYFSRLDLIVSDGQIKLIEINCDTPTGYLETSVANDVITSDKGFKSPNDLEYNIFRAWRMIEKDYGINGETVYFTSYGENEEDRQTVLFNMRNSGMMAEYIAVEDIVIDENGLYDLEGNQIEFLYRLYPLEFLPTDVDSDGKEIGKMFLDHIADGTVKIINPPSSFMMQSKAVMAIIWDFYVNRHEAFTLDELYDINEYFLPTSFDNHFTGEKHVEKPVFGREGGGVVIFDEINSVIEKDEENWYSEYNKIYQKYTPMPDFTLDTWGGEYTGKLLVGSFLIGGEPSGLFLRVGEKITGNLSMFCAVAVV
jgi:glutathionylspermidine synthase